FHFLRLRELLLGTPQCLLGFNERRDVARDLCEADKLTAAVMEGIDDRVRVEAAAILTHSDALTLIASLAACGRENLLREPSLAVEIGEEPVEGLPYDLVGRPAFDPLGAGVPSQHDAIGVEYVDRIVSDAVDEQLELLRVEQRCLARRPSELAAE